MVRHSMFALEKTGSGMATVGANAVLMAPRRCNQHVWSCCSHWCREVVVLVVVRRNLEGLVHAGAGGEEDAEVEDVVEE